MQASKQKRDLRSQLYLFVKPECPTTC